mmetsp:Transcript_26738/g.70926  ORF Transcript_26738/g.70926 Transcript_26738/m.70926 type:complete len:169 (-) Transcript_26738:216-722(-)
MGRLCKARPSTSRPGPCSRRASAAAPRPLPQAQTWHQPTQALLRSKQQQARRVLPQSSGHRLLQRVGRESGQDVCAGGGVPARHGPAPPLGILSTLALAMRRLAGLLVLPKQCSGDVRTAHAMYSQPALVDPCLRSRTSVRMGQASINNSASAGACNAAVLLAVAQGQ